MKFITGYSAWEDTDFVVTIRPEFERAWKSIPIGGVLDKRDAKRIAEWLRGALPQLWKIFTNIAAKRERCLMLDIASEFIEKYRYDPEGNRFCMDCGVDPTKLPHDPKCLIARWDKLKNASD